MITIPWKNQTNIYPFLRKKVSAETSKKSCGNISNQFHNQDQQEINDDEIDDDDETVHQQYIYFSSNIFTHNPNLIDDSLFFFISHARLINEDIFRQLLIILTSILKAQHNFQIAGTQLDFKDVESTEINLLITIDKSVRIENKFCNILFQEGYYNDIISIIRNGYENSSAIIVSALQILTTISNISYQFSLNLSQLGLFDEMIDLFELLTQKPPYTHNWEVYHCNIFEASFNLLFGLLHYPQIFIDEESSRLQFLHDIYSNICKYTFEDLSDNFKYVEVSISLYFIRQIYICIEKLEISNEILIEFFSNMEIFQWIIELFCLKNNEQVQVDASDVIVAITASFDEFSEIFIKDQHFVSFFDELESETELCDELKCNICLILRNLAANQKKNVVYFVFNSPNIMNFLKYQMNAQFHIKFEALHAILNLILFLNDKRIDEYLTQNLDIFPSLVDAIDYDQDSFLEVLFEAMTKILYIYENKHEENIFAKKFYEIGLLDAIDQFDDTEKSEKIIQYMTSTKDLLEQSIHFDNMDKVEEHKEEEEEEDLEMGNYL